MSTEQEKAAKAKGLCGVRFPWPYIIVCLKPAGHSGNHGHNKFLWSLRDSEERE